MSLPFKSRRLFKQRDPQGLQDTSPAARRTRVFLRLFLYGGALGVTLCLFAWVRNFRRATDRSQYLPSVVYYHRVKKGMTQEAVETSCGRPEYAQQMNNLGDEAEAWFYTASDGAIQVVFDEGKVKTVSRQ